MAMSRLDIGRELEAALEDTVALSDKKSRWQEEFDALPEWAQKMVRALSGYAGFGTFDPRDFVDVERSRYQGFRVVLRRGIEWDEGFLGMLELAEAMSAPPPPSSPPPRERRVFNVVEALAGNPCDDPEGGGFDQPCVFGNRVGHHAVYCHNSTWPDSPRKCRRGPGYARLHGISEKENRHENCPGFCANPDYKPT
jgi:hypothetical protein